MRWPRLILLVVAFAAPVAADAASWPDRPLTMLYPFAAGSSGDGIGRILAARLGELLGQPVIYENLGGAGGMTGIARVAKAAPDGHQFLLGGTFMAVHQTIYKRPLYDAVADFEPVALLTDQPTVLIVRKDFPASTLQEFITYAKANQDKMQYGSGGPGSVTHLSCELLNAAIGVRVTHIPYRGGAGPLQDLVAGRLDYQCPIITVALPMIQSGAVKTIAVLSKERAPILPDIPSAHEQGLRDFEVNNWYGFFLPKGTPPDIVKKLHDATMAALETPHVQQQIKALGGIIVPPAQRTPAYLREFLASEIRKWAAPIKAGGLQID